MDEKRAIEEQQSPLLGGGGGGGGRVQEDKLVSLVSLFV